MVGGREGNPSCLSPINLTYDHSIKKERLITDVAIVGTPVGADFIFFGVFDVFCPIETAFVAGEPLCDLETTS